MSDYSVENEISLESILAEFEAGSSSPDSLPVDDIKLAAENVEVNLSSSEKVSLGNIDSASPVRSSRVPDESEIRSYLDDFMKQDYLSISDDISTPRQDHEELDRRFHIGEIDRTPVYNGEKIDTNIDSDYIPSEQEVFIYSGEDSPFAALEEKEKRKKRLTRKEKRETGLKLKEERARLEDTAAFSAESFEAVKLDDFLPDKDTGFELDEEHISAYDGESEFFPSTFKGYLSNLLTVFLYRFRKSRVVSDDSYDEEEKLLGQEVKPLKASKYYGAYSNMLRLRWRISAVLCLILVYITAGLPVPGMLKDIRVAAVFCAGLQLTVMLLGLDVCANAAVNISRGIMGADFLAVISCIVTTLDAFMVAKSSSVSPHMPFCALSSLSLCGVMLSSLVSARALRKALRVPGIGRKIYAVTGESGTEETGATIVKSQRGIEGFVRRSEETPCDESQYIKTAPFIIVAAALVTILITVIKKAGSDMLFIFSAVLSPAAPVCMLLNFALPYLIGSVRIFSSGAAIAGWSGLYDIGRSKTLIITDRDLFPEGSVEIDSVRVFTGLDADEIISYAGSLAGGSGMACAGCFVDLMKKNGCEKMRVENFEILPSGGFKGLIRGDRVLVGNSDFMRLMDVKVPYRIVDSCSVLIAVNGMLAGIFKINYHPLKKVHTALIKLIRSNRRAVFAVRDFNITPGMLSKLFDISTDGYEFPPYIKRFEISSVKASRESKISAVVCREGLTPLVEMADTGRSMYVTALVNTYITMISGFAGMLFSAVRLIGPGSVSAPVLLLIMIIPAIIVAALSFFMPFE